MKRILVFSILLFAVASLPGQETELTTGWKAIKASELHVDGCLLTLNDPDLSQWMEAVVPGTVLTTLLKNRKIPDPFFGMNNELIADIYAAGKDEYTYWFFNRFSTEGIDSTKQVWLTFRGINYQAEVFLNGRRMSTDPMEGMFLRHKFNITPYLNDKGHNRLAVLVSPPLHPGNPNGGQGGDGTIGRDVTMQFTAGWDWVQPVRDRNTGIWDKVTIELTDDVDIRDVFARPRVPGVREPGELQDPAFATFSARLVNMSNKPVEGEVVLTFLNNTEKRKLRLEPGSVSEVVFNEMKQNDPKLWWPNGIGQQSLYPASVTFFTKDGKVSDREEILFGFREVGSYFDNTTGSRTFTINGQKIFIKGGNWIASDAMLRLSPERYEAEIKMHADMNMNMIRVWGGSITERPEFYKFCDKYGIMVWQDLWITGDCNGRWPDEKKAETQLRRREYPDDHSLFIASLADQVKMLRNHPSLVIWCGGNEFPPVKELDIKIRKTLADLDGTRYYLDESTSPELVTNNTGNTADGPYTLKDPLWFFTQRWFGFNPEIGSVGLPNIENMRRIMDEKDLVPPSGEEVNETWRYHKYLGFGNSIEQYGPVTGIEDFITKAQLVTYEQYRSLQEGNNAHMWEWYTGLLVWKNQNPWTALKGQFYDWFLDQNASYYAYKHAAAPLHMQLNLNDSSISMINATPRERKGLRAEAVLTDEKGNELWKKSIETSVAANSVTRLWDAETPAVSSGVMFLKMRITYLSTGVLIDENTYWLPANNDRKQLTSLPAASVNARVTKSANGKFTVEVNNPGGVASFFVRMKVVRVSDGTMVSPVIFDDNYIVILPGEKKTLMIDTTSLGEQDRNTPLMLDFRGVNLEPYTIRL